MAISVVVAVGDVADPLAEAIVERMRALTIGDGNDIDVSVDGYVRQIRGDDWDNGSIVVDELRTLNFRDDFGADLWVGNPSGPPGVQVGSGAGAGGGLAPGQGRVVGGDIRSRSTAHVGGVHASAGLRADRIGGAD